MGGIEGRLGPHGGRRNNYGDRLALLAQLEIFHPDGTTTVVSYERFLAGCDRSDPWPPTCMTARHHDAAARADRLGGARLRRSRLASGPRARAELLGARRPDGLPVRRTELVALVSMTRAPSGKLIVDFGQNLVGRLRIRLRGESGQTVTLRHAEILENGELCVRPLPSGGGDRPLHAPRRWGGSLGAALHLPRLSVRRTRRGPCELGPDDVRRGRLPLRPTADRNVRVLGSARQPTPRERRLEPARQLPPRPNGLRPARRASRPGPATSQIFAPTALFLYDTAGFLTSWLADLAAEQDADGRVPNVVPEVLDGLRLGKHDHSVPGSRVGRRGRHRPLDDLQANRGLRSPRGAVPEHVRVGRPRGAARRPDTSLDAWVPVRRLARPDSTGRHARARPDGSCPRRDGILRALRPPARTRSTPPRERR